MLQLSDIKVTHKNAPEPFLTPQAPKASFDNSSAASFFSILKNQMDAAAVPAADMTTQPDMTRNGARTESADRDNAPREAARPKGHGEETPRAEANEAELAQKEAAKAQNRETRSADAVKNADKKQVDTPVQKKAAENGAEPAARPSRAQRAKKTEDADMRDLFDGLHRMMDVIKGSNQTDIRASRGGREPDDLLNASRGKAERNVLKGLFDRLESIMKKIDAKNIPAAQADHLARTVNDMKHLLQKARHGGDRNRMQANASPAEPALAAVKDLIVRVESLLDGAKGEGPQNRPGNESRGSGDLFGMAHLKGDLQARRADTAPAPQRQGAFMENVNQIIENAKVVVRDSRNGSFSVRLHPRDLGSLNVSLGLENGIVHGRFLVETPEAKDLLMSSMDQIRQQLADAGIAVGEFQVDVNDRRGRMLRDADREREAVMAPAGRQEEIAVEFESNSKSLHDGHINLVI